jgi:ubiquinone/menaquinone biosynthesis C-methylase UbiE
MERFADQDARTDRAYLLTDQYRDPSNLSARYALHDRFSTNRYGWHRWVFDELKLSDRHRVLEVGCGAAFLWRANIDRLLPAARVTLTDFSTGMVAEAVRHLPSIGVRGVRFGYAVADVQRLPFADSCFDTVAANHMLYHVPDREAAFREIRRVLVPGGRLVAATNGRHHLRELDELVGLVLPASASDLDATAFSLENGPEQVAPWFDRVTLRRYDDSLAITEVEPIVAYVRSSPTWSKGLIDTLPAFRRALAARLAETGVIRVSKDTGLLLAERGRT